MVEYAVRSRYRLVIGAVLILVSLSVGLNWVGPGPLMPLIMEEYGITRGTASWAMSVVSLVMAIIAVPAGILASKIGLRKTFAIGAFLMAGGLLTWWTPNIILFLATRFLFAVGVGMTFPMVGGIVMQWFKGGEVPLMNGLSMAAASVGNALSLSLGVLIATALTWRAPLFIYASVAFLAALGWLFLGRERHNPGTHETGATIPLPALTLGDAVKQRTTVLLAFSLIGPFGLFMAISSWLPTYYYEVFDIPLAKASAMTALFTYFGILAALLGGILPMWVGLRKPFIVIPGLLMGFAGLGTFAVNNPWVIYPAISLFGVTNLIFLPSLFTIPIELPHMTPRSVALVTAVALAVGNLFGATGAMTVSYLADLTGSYVLGFAVYSVLAWSLLIGGLLLPETGPRAKKITGHP